MRVLVPDFFSGAAAAREALERCLAGGGRRIWSYANGPRGTFLEADAEGALGAELCERFVGELRAWSAAHLGLGLVSRPTLVLHVAGGPPPGGGLAYELSLDSNRLLVVDEGGMDPAAGRAVLRGHLASSGAIVDMAAGAEGFREAARHMVDFAGREARARLARLEPPCEGLLALRFRVDDEGAPVHGEVLHDGLRSLAGGPPPDGLREAALEELAALRVPGDLGLRSFTCPIVLGGPAPPPEPVEEAPAPPPRLPDPAPAGAAPLRIAGGRPIRVLASLASPRVVLLGGVLSDDECDELISRALPSVQPSRVVDPGEGHAILHPERTSSHTALFTGADPFLRRIDRRLCELCDWPPERSEELQVTHYLPGAQYRPHYDYFAPVHTGSSRPLARGGNRVATLIIYLAVPDEGGATIFPDVGLDVAPVKGHAVFFSYPIPDPSTRTKHGGAPVLRGEKWIATKWFREEVVPAR